MHQTETIKHTGNKDDKLFYQTQTRGLQVPWGSHLNPHGDSCRPPSQLRGFVHALPSSGNALPYRFSCPSSKSSQVPGPELRASVFTLGLRYTPSWLLPQLC